MSMDYMLQNPRFGLTSQGIQFLVPACYNQGISKQMKIVVVDSVRLFPQDIATLRSLGEYVQYDTECKDDSELFERLKDAEIIIVYGTRISDEMIAKLDKAKILIACAAGYDWVNIDAAKKKGILVAHCPGNNSEAVAEFTLGLLIMASRNAFDAARKATAGEYSQDYHGAELQERTLGVIGYGTIGKRVTEIAKNAFNMQIIPINSASTRQDLEKLLTSSDFISINAPSNEKTKNMIGADEFKLMKDGVVLVNTGRGSIIDEDALYDALKSGKVHGAGLDVMQTEPYIKGHKLFQLPNVIITPHIAYNTEETDLRLSAQVAEIAKSFVEGNPKYIIPEMKKAK